MYSLVKNTVIHFKTQLSKGNKSDLELAPIQNCSYRHLKTSC